jgi:hypothetical protein
MPSTNGEAPSTPLELSEILQIETKDGTRRPFKVVGILEDEEDGASYAVLVHEPDPDGEGEFIVTDLDGNLLENGGLAQEILDDFLTIAQEGEDGGTPA